MRKRHKNTNTNSNQKKKKKKKNGRTKTRRKKKTTTKRKRNNQPHQVMPCLRVFSCIKKNMGILEFQESTSMILVISLEIGPATSIIFCPKMMLFVMTELKSLTTFNLNGECTTNPGIQYLSAYSCIKRNMEEILEFRKSYADSSGYNLGIWVNTQRHT